MKIATYMPKGLRVALLMVLVLAAIPMAASAQISTPVAEQDRRTIAVEGTGTVDVTPDTADVTFGVLTQDESLETAQNENIRRTEALMETLSEAGIAEEDIETSNYSVRVINEYDRDGNLVGVQGYEVWNSVTVTIRDISIVGTVLDAAIGAGANEVSSINFYVDNTDAAASQARTAAVENAREKADELAEAAGVIVTGVYSIEETAAPQPEPVQYAMQESDALAADEAAPREVPVSPGQQTISVSVQVVYEIEQPQG